MSGWDWINVVTFGLGLVLIFAAGFWSGRLWERGTSVRRVMTGEDPPPWDDPSDVVFIPTDWTEPVRIWDETYDPRIPTRTDVYDQDRDGFA